MTDQAPALVAQKPSEIVAEYEKKLADLDRAVEEFRRAEVGIRMASTVFGAWGSVSIDTGRVDIETLRASLLTSAWRHLYSVLHIERLATVREKKAFEQSLSSPAPFTMDNIRATFGRYIADPRGSILRGLAEVFCELDPAYKSHDKVKIGVKGLPKRIILHNIGSYTSWGEERMRNVINALATYQEKPLLTREEASLILRDGEALRDGGTYPHPWNSRHEYKTITVPARGLWLKRFKNGNGHLFFGPETLRDINLALAEFYGDVLPDCADDERPAKPRASTAVSKDLQYYPTPEKVVARVLDEIGIRPGVRVLEPSSGCGRFLDALRKRGALCVGFEVDPGRANVARAKGHRVMIANFLETVPTGDFDLVVMNPPFYGRHYAKHVEHALRFLKPGGRLVAILPATARYDHGLVDGRWYDLPVGSFSESGTNINTSVLTIWTPRAD